MQILNLVITTKGKFDRTLADISQGSFKLGEQSAGNKPVIFSRHAKEEIARFSGGIYGNRNAN